MKALLLHPDRDFDLRQEPPPHAPDLTQDLALDTLLAAMAGDDAFVLDVARRALLTGTANDLDTIRHRQQVLRDCLLNPQVVRDLYQLAVETIERRRKYWYGVFSTYPPAILHGAIELMQMLVAMLKRLRNIADLQAGRFQSRGFAELFAMLQREFDDAYFARIEAHLDDLKLRGGVLMSAALGPGNEGTRYVLHRPPQRRERWLAWLRGRRARAYTFHLADRDEAGARALGELRDRGVNLVANALAQSTDHVLAFFDLLRTELAFYVGCLNLREKLAALDVPICLPQPYAAGARELAFRGLRDPCLALTLGRTVVGNDLDAAGKRATIVTGANQGGKSSFLRAIGLAQVMLQAGLFVAAESYAGELATGLYTHYRREEDATMRMGKFDEELHRLSGIVDVLTPRALVLFNESFAATNEREGSEIARQIVDALLDGHVKVFFVTHLYEFAHAVHASGRPDALFLRAERLPDGTRTFRIVPGEPLETSHGRDLFDEVFAAAVSDPRE